MHGLAILETLRALGVAVQAAGPNKLRLEPASKIPNNLLPRIREAKLAILEALRKFPASCSPECYEVVPGVWIHRPWAGCLNGRAESIGPHTVFVTCWHCGGLTKCDCVACWERGPGECVTCKGNGQVLRWVQ
jgi:hypothetical protein